MPSRGRAVDDDAVQMVGARIGQHRVQLWVQQPFFDRQAGVGPADVEAALRHVEIARQLDLYPHWIDSTMADDSTVSETAFRVTQQPE